MSDQPKPRRGRPPLPENERQDPRHISLRLYPELRARLLEAAEAHGTTLSGEIATRLTVSLERDLWVRELRQAIRSELAGEPLSEASNADD